jgi:SAM-dependent methyltransferase
MDCEQIKQYWDERAASDGSAQSTTQDYYLREIEFRVLKSAVETYLPQNVLDIGCGDARTTGRLASTFGDVSFVGCDYAESMVRNARNNVEGSGLKNLRVEEGDVVKSLPEGTFDLIYTTRCLINLPTWNLQKEALFNIAGKLSEGGIYVMIENFVEGQENFNVVRIQMGLPEIPVRFHNTFFATAALEEFISSRFEIVEQQNISSTYYLVSRVVYSKLCQTNGMEPDYFDDHHKLAAQLPFAGNFGPVRMLVLRRN